MRRIPAKIISPILQRFVKVYFKKPRSFQYKGIKGTILPTVFFPHFTMSTKLFMDFMDEQPINGKHLLELGCGTGFISTLCGKKGALVTASDINPKAVENATLNAQKNGVKINPVLSDLFTTIPPQTFDYILINPPYYPKNPADMKEKAWFCGADFDYFHQLFTSIRPYINKDSKILMILSEDCDFNQIKAIAETNNFRFETVFTARKKGEDHFIYQIH